MEILAGILWGSLVCGSGFLVGYWARGNQARRDEADLIDRYERIVEQPNRRGEHHNWSSPESTVRKGHMLNRRSWKVHHPES